MCEGEEKSRARGTQIAEFLNRAVKAPEQRNNRSIKKQSHDDGLTNQTERADVH